MKEQVITEANCEVYYSYDLNLISAILHNGSLAGVNNPHPLIEYSPDHVKVVRSASEELLIGVDHQDKSLMLMVCNPHIADTYRESTAIYLSHREIHALRTLLNHLVE